MKALITGGGGQLGSDLQALLGAEATSFRHDELDVTDAGAVERVFTELRPDVVFNCAAFHNVDSCETEPGQAFQTNVTAVADLARRGAKLVHVSTNYVFDGRRAEPYGENDTPNPRSMYAITKLAGEYAALSYGDNALVVRGAGLYGLSGSASKGGNFVQRMIRCAHELGTLKMVDDQLLQPTFTADLAEGIVAAVQGGAGGIVHLTAGGECSWYEFTEAIMELAGIDVPIERVQTTIPAGSPDRPLNGVLANPRAVALGLGSLRPWREALEDYMTRAALVAP